MRKKLREAHYFFYSQAFADGFRATVVIVLPALIGSYLNYFQTGLIIPPPTCRKYAAWQVRLRTYDLL